MHITDNNDLLFADIARAADLSMKPWLHSVLNMESSDKINKNSSFNELIIRIECRDSEGIRYPGKDLDLEIYRSGSDISLTLFKVDPNEKSILWHGNKSIWMDADSGTSCDAPNDGLVLESFARRLRALFLTNLK